MFKTRNQYLEILDSFSEKFSRESFSFQSFDWWPVIKIHISLRLHQFMTKEVSLRSNSFHEIKIDKKKYSIFSILKAKFIRGMIKNNICHVAVFTSNRNKTTKHLDGSLINQFTFPFIIYFNKLKIDYKVYDTVSFNVTNLGHEIYHNEVVNQYNLNFDFQNKIKKIDEYFNDILPGLYYSISDTIIRHQIDYLSYLYFFNKNKIKHVLFYCYYSENIMPLLLAANKSKISTTEYQHSLISEDHFAYIKWNNRLDDSYLFFPKNTWCWSDEDALFLKNNFCWIKDYNSFVGGNIYYSLIENSIEKQKSDVIRVLVTLQGIGIPIFLKDYISKSSNIVWYFRSHPRYPQDKNEINEIHKLNPNNTNITEANSLSLYELLSMSDFHMTCFSGSAIEAELAGVKNIIYGIDGARSYKEKIKSGKYFYTDSEESLNLILKNASLNVVRDDVKKLLNTEEIINAVFA